MIKHQRRSLMDFKSLRSIKTRLDSEELRGRRSLECHQLRKVKRGKEIDMNRKPSDDIFEDLIEDVIMLDVNNNKPNAFLKDEWINGLFSDKIFVQETAAYKLSGILLSNKSVELFEEIVKAGLVPRLFELIQCNKNKQVQLRSAMALLDVSMHSIKDLIPHDGINVLATLLDSSDNRLFKEQLINIFGNIAGESLEFRDRILGSGMLDTLLKLVTNSYANINILRKGAWTLSQLCFGKDPKPDKVKISLCIPVLADLVKSEDVDVITDSCWALSHLMSGCKSHIQAVIDTGICPRLVQLLGDQSSVKIVPAALYSVGNIVIGTDMQTQVIVDCDPIFSAFHSLLTDKEQTHFKVVCWIISNIAAGNRNQIQTVINSKICPIVLAHLANTSFIEVQQEAAWVFRQGINRSRTSLDQLDYFVSIGSIPILCKLIHGSPVEILYITLKTIRTILDFRNVDHFNQIKNFCDIKCLESLESHGNCEIRRFASHILDYLVD